MGGVKLESFYAQVGGGRVPAITSWSDDFTDPTAEFYRKYMSIGTLGLNTVNANGTGVVQFTGIGPNASNPAGLISPFVATGIKDKSQFTRVTYVADNGAGVNANRPAIGVLATGNPSWNGTAPTMKSYLWILRRELNNSLLVKNINGNPTPSQTALIDPLPYPALGSIIELQGRILSAVSVQLDVLVNGLNVGTFTDNVAPYIHGMPGIGIRLNCNVGFNFSFTNFEAGIL